MRRPDTRRTRTLARRYCRSKGVMFYPEAFPTGTPLLDAASTLKTEFDAMCLLLQADRDYLSRQSPEGLVRGMLAELEFCGAVDSSTAPAVADLIERNAETLFHFVADH